MSKQHYFKTLFLVFLVFPFSNALFAQESVSLGEHNGLAVSYTVQFLGSINKKKASKSRDEYQLTTIVENKNMTTLYSRNSILAGVKIGNATSLTKTARVTAPRSRFLTSDSAALYIFEQGGILRNSVKIRVPKGQKPVVVYDSPNNIFQPLDNFEIMINDIIVNGTWRPENSSQALALTFNRADNTIRQQGTDGTLIIWYKTAPRTFQRVLQGAMPNLNTPNPDNSQSYTAKIVFLDTDRILYSNSEGITINWVKNK